MTVRSPGQVTAAWLTGVLGGGEVTEVTVEPAGPGGGGRTGRVARLRLRWDQGLGPATVFAKFPDPAVSGLTAEHHRRELLFHEKAAPGLDVRVPRLLFGEIDDEGRGVLLFEDIDARPTSLAPGDCTAAEVGAVLEDLARLHGPTWNTAGFDWLPRPDLEPAALARRFIPLAERLFDRCSDRLGAGTRRLLLVLHDRHEALVRRMLAVPFALVHCDLNPGNVLFPRVGRPVLLDWQLVSVLPHVIDVAQVLGEGLGAADRRSAEDELLRRHHACLEEQGVKGYALDRLRDDYAFGLAFRATVLIRLAAEAPDDEPARWLDVGPLRQAIEDHDVAGRLAALAGCGGVVARRIDDAPSAEQLDRLVRLWRERSLPVEEWTHRAHLHVALRLVTELGLDRAVPALRSGIRAYNESVGVQNTDRGGYHETITLFFAWAVAEHAAAWGNPEDPLVAHAELAGSDLDDKRLVLRWWTRERIATVAARRGWVPPDRRPLPPGVAERLAELAGR